MRSVLSDLKLHHRSGRLLAADLLSKVDIEGTLRVAQIGLANSLKNFEI